MLLTIFYVAAAWMQSRRLGSLRAKINQFASSQASLVFYKIPEEKNEDRIEAIVTSSFYCENQEKAMIEEVLHFTTNTRSCVLLPQQIVNISNWITITDESLFPVQNNKEKTILKQPRIFLLLEADYLRNSNSPDARYYNLNEIGLAKAWRANENLGMIIESDIDHLIKLSSSFLSSPIFFDFGFEISRIQTVAVKGESLGKENIDFLKSPFLESQNFPSFADNLNTNKWSSMQASLQLSPTFRKHQMEQLRILSQHAGVTSQDTSVLVLEEKSASVTPGNKSFDPHTPEFASIPEDSVEEAVIEGKKNLPSESTPANESLTEMKLKSWSAAVLTADIPNKSSAENSSFASAQSTPSKNDFEMRKNTFSSLGSFASASTLSVSSISVSSESGKTKPPNVFIYSESPTTTENIKSVLHDTLHKYKYTIYSITGTQLFSSMWAKNCFLLVVCGNVPQQIEPILTSYLIQGGKLFCLCSSFLHTLLPTFRTAEVRERELVHFSYGRWRRVRLMHHVFCYQNSPSRTKFSVDSETSNDKDRVSPLPQTPSSVEVIDNNGVSHTLHVQVLGVEETWQTPSLLLAYFASPGGCAVFSQVHLELDPSQGADEEEEEELRKSAVTRKEIIKDILTTHLGMEIGGGVESPIYTVAYFLGLHETKLNFLEKIKPQLRNGVLKLERVSLKFCKSAESLPQATPHLLPILVHSCPGDFSTVEYFENLTSRSLGRLLIYSEVMGSSMDIVNGELAHGFVVVPSQQTSGKGRTSNHWLSPPGCAMFSLQLHFPSDSYMGRHPSIIQHVVSAAIAISLTQTDPDYQKAFNLNLKWPNDLYVNGSTKIGGLIVTCFASKSNIICNIGCGINLDNEVPTTCLNKLIENYNRLNDSKVKKLSREKLLAVIFNQIEQFLDVIEEGNIEYVKNLYYKYWLHGGAQVRVLDSSGLVRQVTIMGIDDFGFLKVQESSGKSFIVHPDGNSFDMMEGLIAPKLK